MFILCLRLHVDNFTFPLISPHPFSSHPSLIPLANDRVQKSGIEEALHGSMHLKQSRYGLGGVHVLPSIL